MGTENSKPGDLVVTGSATVFLEGDLVIFEVAHVGRMEFPPEIAEKLSRALMEGAQRLQIYGPVKGSTRIV